MKWWHKTDSTKIPLILSKKHPGPARTISLWTINFHKSIQREKLSRMTLKSNSWHFYLQKTTTYSSKHQAVSSLSSCTAKYPKHCSITHSFSQSASTVNLCYFRGYLRLQKTKKLKPQRKPKINSCRRPLPLQSHNFLWAVTTHNRLKKRDSHHRDRYSQRELVLLMRQGWRRWNRISKSSSCKDASKNSHSMTNQ